MILLRVLVRLVSFLLLVVLSLLGLAVAVTAIDPGGIAGLVRLPALRDTVGAWFDELAGDGPFAKWTLVGGVAAVLLGLLLLVGALVPRRERLVTLSSNRHGSIAARRRAVAAVAQTLAEQVGGVTEAKVKVRPRRRGGGKLRVRAARPRPASAREVERGVKSQLEPLTGPFRLRASIQSRVGGRGSRVR